MNNLTRALLTTVSITAMVAGALTDAASVVAPVAAGVAVVAAVTTLDPADAEAAGGTGGDAFQGSSGGAGGIGYSGASGTVGGGSFYGGSGGGGGAAGGGNGGDGGYGASGGTTTVAAQDGSASASPGGGGGGGGGGAGGLNGPSIFGQPFGNYTGGSGFKGGNGGTGIGNSGGGGGGGGAGGYGIVVPGTLSENAGRYTQTGGQGGLGGNGGGSNSEGGNGGNGGAGGGGAAVESNVMFQNFGNLYGGAGGNGGAAGYGNGFSGNGGTGGTGGVGAYLASGAEFGNFGVVKGGTGGTGGAGATPGTGGGGGIGTSGAGGAGVLALHGGTIQNYGHDSITGGNGGAGYIGGSGGAGGAGISAANARIINYAYGLITGGNGGASGGGSGLAGAGGVGISGSGLTVYNNGTVKGGYSADITPIQAAGIEFSGTGNLLSNNGTVAGGVGVLVDANGTANITNLAGASLTGTTGAGVQSYGNLTLANLGTITSGASMVANGTNAVEIDAGGDGSTVHNAGNITALTLAGVYVAANGTTVTNDSTGIITGGSDATHGYGVVLTGGSTGNTVNNYGSITGGTGGIIVDAGSNATINLYAGSTTSNINLSADGGDSIVSLYTGLGTNNTGLIDATANNATQQANSTVAAAVYGNITGNTGDVLELRGTGDGTAGNGAAGVIDLSSAPNGTGAISGFTQIDKFGSGTWQFYNAAGDATTQSSAAIQLDGGTIDAKAVGAFGSGTITVTDPATIEFSANGSYANLIELAIASPTATNALTIGADSGVTANVTSVLGSAAPGEAIIIGGSAGGTALSGTVILGATETYTGTTTINGGTLSLGTSGDVSSSSQVNIISGTLDVSEETATPTINNLSGSAGTVELGAQGLTVDSSINTEFSGTINQSVAGGLFTKTGNGTLELGGANTFTAGTVIANGTLELASPNALVDSASVNLTSANSILNAASTGVAGATIHNLTGVSGSQVQFGTKGLTVTETGSTKFAGTITGTGGPNGTLTIDGGGNLTLTGQNTYTANTIVSNNTTLILGESASLVNESNILASGDNVTVTDTSTLYMDIYNGAGKSISQTFGNVTLGTSGAPGGTLHIAESAHATINYLSMTNGTVITDGEGNTLLDVETLSGNGTIIIAGTTFNLGANGSASTYSGNLTIDSDGIMNAGILTFNGTLTASEGSTFTATNFNQTGGSVSFQGNGFGSVGNVTTYNLSGGVLNVRGGNTTNGNLTIGTMNQTGGTVDITVGQVGGLLGATTYNLSNGTLTVFGGESGSGTLTATTFNQTGGSATIGAGEHGGNITATTYNMTAGTLDIQGSGTHVAAGSLDATTFNMGGGNITITGGAISGGTLTASTFNQSAGTINIGSNLANAQLAAGTFHQTGGSVSLGYDGLLAVGMLTGANGTIVIGEGGEVEVGSGNASSTYGGDISSDGSGDGEIIEQGTGTLTLSGNNSNYTGYIEIDSGVLQAGSTNAFGGTYVYVNTPGTLDLAGYNNAIYSLNGGANSTVTDSSTTADTLELYQGGTFGGVIADGAGKTSVILDGGSLYLGGVNTYSGTTTVSSGATLYLGIPACGTTIQGASIANSSVADAGTVDVSYNGNTSAIASLSGNGTVNMGSGLLILTNANGTFSGVLQDGGVNGGTGATLEIAAGREVLSGTNTFTGNTGIGFGAVLQLGNGGTTGSLAGPIVDDGTLAFDLTGTSNVSGISGTGGLEVDAGTVMVTQASTLSGATLIKPNATLALSGGGTLDVPLTDDGTFGISAASSGRTIQSLAGNGTITLGENTLTLSSANGTFSGVIGGGGGLSLTGGEQTLSGANTYTGATTIGANTTLALSGTGSIVDSSGVADVGTFDISATTNGATVNALTGAGNVILGNQTLTIADGSGTFSGVASGTGGLTIAGGTETLSGTNTYTGTTTIGANATLAMSGTGVPGTGQIVDDGTFDISASSNGATVGSLAGTGGVYLGAETLTISNGNGTFSGNITDGHHFGSVIIAGGTETLTGDNTYSGGTIVDGGSTLVVGNPDSLGTGTIVFEANSTIAFAANATFDLSALFQANAPVFDVGGHTVTWSGPLSGPGDLAVTGSGGTLILTSVNNYQGGTEVYGGATLEIGADSELGGVAPLQLGNATTAGTLELADSFNLAAGRTITLEAGGGTIDTQAFNTTVAQAIGGTGALTKDGSGKLILTAANTYSGGTTIAKGTVQIGNGGTTGSVAGNIADDGALVFDRSNAMTYAGVVSGNGTLTQSGDGTLTLTSTNTLTGATSVNDGTLLVNGSLAGSAVTVNSGATLGGTGKAGATTVASGGTLAPGVGGAGTLTVAGNLVLASGSTTDIDLTPTAADKIAVTGTAKLGGTLALSAGAGTYTATDYTLVTASSVSGTFSSVTGGVTGFDSKLVYDPTLVMLDLTASSSGGGGTPPVVVTYDFSAYGKTPNEIAAGTALEAADPSGSLYKAVGVAVAGDPATAPGKLNQLTGEIHASARSALIEDGRAIRDSVLDHLAQDPDGMTAWGTAFGGNGRIDATGNTGALHHSNSGFIAGVDTPISGWSPDLRIGLAGAYNADHASISGLDSTLHGSTGHLVAYAGWTGGPWAAKAGLDLGWGNMHVTRDVSFLTESEHSSQSTRTTQEFGDVGYNIALDGAALQPYFDLAHIDVKTGGFTEAGGLAALNGNGASNDVTYSTLGGRVSLNPWAMGSWGVTPRLDIGWQHAFSRVNPVDAVTYNDNSQDFTVDGAPLDKDAAAIQAGVDIAIAPQAVISLTYDGTFSSKVKDNTFRGGLIWKF